MATARQQAARKRRKKEKINKFLCVAVVLLAGALFLALEQLNKAGRLPAWDKLAELFGNDAVFSESIPPENTTKIHFIDVGQGDAVVVQSDGCFALIDAGEMTAKASVLRCLEDLGVERLELVVMSHAHSDHIGSMAAVLKEYEVGQVLMPNADLAPPFTSAPFERVLELLAEKNIPVSVARVGAKYKLGSGVFSVMGAGVESTGLNDTSIALRFVDGDFSFLTTGDGEKAVEKDLLSRSAVLKADVFKAAHHGSDTSNTPEFMMAVCPQLVVVSCGRDNEYGHPAQSVLETCKMVGANVLRTDEQGTITVWKDNGKLYTSCTRDAGEGR